MGNAIDLSDYLPKPQYDMVSSLLEEQGSLQKRVQPADVFEAQHATVGHHSNLSLGSETPGATSGSGQSTLSPAHRGNLTQSSPQLTECTSDIFCAAVEQGATYAHYTPQPVP